MNIMYNISVVQIIFVAIISAVVNYFVYSKTKNITYIGKKLASDNEKMIETSAQLSMTNWPSRMHDIAYSRSQLREVWVLALSILIKFCKFKKNERTNIALSLLSNWLSTILIYLISANFLSMNESLLVSLIYLTSSWTYQIALYLGHVIFSQTWALLSILLLVNFFTYNKIILLLLSSIFITTSFFSSSASRKYPYLWICLLIYFEHIFSSYGKYTLFKSIYSNYYVCIPLLLITVLYFLAKKYVFKSFLYLVRLKFSENKILKIQSRSDIQKFIIKTIYIFLLLVCMVVTSALRNKPQEILQIFAISLGVIIVCFYILGPNILAGINRYRIYLKIGEWANHFKVYVKNSEKIFGRAITENFRGGSTKWFIKFQNQVSPVIFYTYVVCIGLIFALCFIYPVKVSISQSIFILLISLIPIIVHYLTGGIQVGKAYYSQIVGYFLFLVYSILVLNNVSIAITFIYSFLIIIFVLSSAHMLFLALPDIIKSRSSTGVLVDFLLSNQISNFSTYNSPFNNTLVEIIKNEDTLNNFKVHYCQSIVDSTDDYFVIPNRSSKSVSMESTELAASGQDFDSDSCLTFLEREGLLEEVSIFKFPTIGSSKYYISESEVTGFRYYQLDQYLKTDFDKTYGRVIDVEKSITLFRDQIKYR